MKPIFTSGKNFEQLIEDGGIYVDKTKYLYSIINSQEPYYFLSRPRRFGKSMTLQTFKAIFEGKRELFKDLFIGKETDYDFKKYPVLYFDFSDLKKENHLVFEDSLNRYIDQIANDFNVDISNTKYVNEKMRLLLKRLSMRDGNVVVLVDEYDAPITKNAFSKDLEKINEVIKEFFTTLKANSQYLRFVFITGVSKFAKVGVFSGMNNLLNISLDSDYATMLGFTEEEIKNNYSEYIEKGIKDLGVNREEYLSLLREHYNGYHFSLDSNESVYNPVSIGLFFTKGKGKAFDDYWVETGSTELLMKMAKENDFSILTEIEMKIDFDSVSSFEVSTLIKNPTPEALLYMMYQTGYLTIKGKDRRGNVILAFPNEEVKASFSKAIITSFLTSKNIEPSLLDTIIENLASGKKEKAFKDINTLYASCSYKNFNKNSTEKQFLNPLIFALNGSLNKSIGEKGLDEYPMSSGEADYILLLEDYIYILEAKLNKSSKEALDSIIERGYYKQFLSSNEKREVILVGLNFNYDKSNQSKMRLLDEPEFLVLDK